MFWRRCEGLRKRENGLRIEREREVSWESRIIKCEGFMGNRRIGDGG